MTLGPAVPNPAEEARGEMREYVTHLEAEMGRLDQVVSDLKAERRRLEHTIAGEYLDLEDLAAGTEHPDVHSKIRNHAAGMLNALVHVCGPNQNYRNELLEAVRAERFHRDGGAR